MPGGRKILTAYARFDASGRIVPGSTVLRTKPPTGGRFYPVETYLCCGPTTTTTTTTTTSSTTTTTTTA
jgi:hypothetical protein